ncbi:MAG: hypothetical protein AB7E81_03580 [Hyphomicrobiaceae bacterium]
MFSKRTLDSCLEQLGAQLLDSDDVKAVMMSKDDDGNVIITLVEGREDSHKVKFGRVDRRSKRLVRNDRRAHHDKNGHAPRVMGLLRA